MKAPPQGQSLSTIDKERQIAGTFAMNLQIVRHKCPNSIYRHFDLNAGSGWNDDFQVDGSPIVFIKLAEQYLNNKWEATFFEFNADRASQLQARLRGIPRCTVLPTDNIEFRKRAQLTIRRHDVGSILADPNGWIYRRPDNGNGCPVEEMIRFFQEYPRIDLIANLNLRFYKSARGASRSHANHPTYPHMYSLMEMPDVFNKRHGLISNRSHNGHTSFVRIVLRNIPTKDYRALGWNYLYSPTALEIYRYAETSATERNQQLAFEELA